MTLAANSSKKPDYLSLQGWTIFGLFDKAEYEDTWLDEVVRRRRQVELVGDVGRREVVHLVVEDDSGRRRHDPRSQTRNERNSSLHRLP